jgi:hypothetical protein
MKKNKGLVATAALVIPACVLAGMACAFERQLVNLTLTLIIYLGIPVGVAVITLVYIKLTVD